MCRVRQRLSQRALRTRLTLGKRSCDHSDKVILPEEHRRAPPDERGVKSSEDQIPLEGYIKSELTAKKFAENGSRQTTADGY